MTTQMYLWLFGMWFIGGLVYTFFGMQIVITKRCALKIFDLLKDETQNWYAEACRKYWKKVIRRNQLIITVITIVLFFLIPGIGFLGFLIGSFTKWLFTLSKTGINKNNVDDSCAIFIRYMKPNREDEFTEDLSKALVHIIDVEYDHQIHVVLHQLKRSVSDFLHTPYGFCAAILVGTFAFVVYLYFA